MLWWNAAVKLHVDVPGESRVCTPMSCAACGCVRPPMCILGGNNGWELTTFAFTSNISHAFGRLYVLLLLTGMCSLTSMFCCAHSGSVPASYAYLFGQCTYTFEHVPLVSQGIQYVTPAHCCKNVQSFSLTSICHIVGCSQSVNPEWASISRMASDR